MQSPWSSNTTVDVPQRWRIAAGMEICPPFVTRMRVLVSMKATCAQPLPLQRLRFVRPFSVSRDDPDDLAVTPELAWPQGNVAS